MPYRRRLFPPLYLLLSLLAMAALDRWLPAVVLLTPPWTWAGILPVLIGLAMTASAARHFVRRGTGLVPFTPVTCLVEDGLYRFSRNPMYLGMLLVLVGMAVWFGTASPWLLPPLFFLILRQRFVLPEEAFLRERLGAPYQAFCQRIPRWL